MIVAGEPVVFDLLITNYGPSDAQNVSVTDNEALAAFRMLTEMEGIIPALESAHAIAYLSKLVPELSPQAIILVCLSGRGDKDIHTVAEAMGVEL